MGRSWYFRARAGAAALSLSLLLVSVAWARFGPAAGGASGANSTLTSLIGLTGAVSTPTTITASGLISTTGGLTITGAAINLNASSNNAVNIGTGSTNAAVTIGGGSNTVAIDSTALDISTTGAITGATTGAFSGALAANGGITFDGAGDMLGAHTLAGTLDASTNILINIGNAGTDFVASTGALTLAGALTVNSAGSGAIATSNGSINSTPGLNMTIASGMLSVSVGSGVYSTATIGTETAGNTYVGVAGVSITSDATPGTSTHNGGGVFVGGYSAASGTLEEAFGVNTRCRVTNAGGTITDCFALTMEDGDSTGTLVNQYGLYIPTLTAGDTLNRGLQIELSVGKAASTEAVTDVKLQAGVARTLLGNHIGLDVDMSTNVTLNSKTMTGLQVTVAAGQNALNIAGGNAVVTGTLTVGGGTASTKPLFGICTVDIGNTLAGALGTATCTSTGTTSSYVCQVTCPTTYDLNFSPHGADPGTNVITVGMKNDDLLAAHDPASATCQWQCDL